MCPMVRFGDHRAILQGFKNGHRGPPHSESRSFTGVPKFDGGQAVHLPCHLSPSLPSFPAWLSFMCRQGGLPKTALVMYIHGSHGGLNSGIKKRREGCEKDYADKIIGTSD